MANPNCIIKNSQRSMMLVDVYTNSDSAQVDTQAAEWAGAGYVVRRTTFKMGPRKTPIKMYKATAYKK